FMTTRLLDDSGGRHIVSLGLRRGGDGRVAVLIQPIVCGGTIVGRHVNNRDPITGLLTRWEVSRALEADGRAGRAGAEAAVILLVLDDFEAISHFIGHKATDVVLLGVAAALNHVFPHPALTSRLMGDTFLAFVVRAGIAEPRRRAEQLLEALTAIEVPGFEPRFGLRGSIGVARVTDGDHDLALRLAEAAAAEAYAAGGQRIVVAGDPQFSSAQTKTLTTCMDLGSWEMWLQPVVRHGHEQAEYHEALARFDGQRVWASRADLFLAGQAQGLLERFDRMMLQRALETLDSHADARLSVNVSYETFISKTFPGSFLELIRRVPDACGRIIIEIAPRCVADPVELVRPRLETLAEAGVAVALDDFGSGVCRLSYLTQWPISIVKLDRLVTGYVDDDPLQRDFVRTVVSLCRARGITTCAEYTRSEEQLTRLVEDGVELFQGELFGMPRPAAEVFAPAFTR
ncbi:MAG: EAL domain-containing protein, partial [Planctomycetia bacterium]